MRPARMYRHTEPERTLVGGPGALDGLGAELASRGAGRVAVIAAASAWRSPGRVRLERSLAGAAIQLVLAAAGVEAHAPLAGTLRIAAELGHRPPDALVAFGGGSATDTAKAAALLMAGQRVGPVSLAGASPGAPAPIVAVPATLSGAEATPSGGATDDRGVKHNFRDQRLTPALLVYDPALALDVPAVVQVRTGFNAIAHCAEALYGPGACWLTDLQATAAAESLARALLAWPRPTAADADRAQQGAFLAGRLLGNTRMALHHAVCHVLGSAAGLSHGLANTVMLPYVLDFNRPATGAAQARLAGALRRGGLSGDSAAGCLRDLARRAGQPLTLAAAGVDRSAIPALTERVLAEPGTARNPRPIQPADVARLLDAAYTGKAAR
jgi:alcohol dehydrogenase class IV